MGARGGAARVTAWKCLTCQRLFERRDGGRAEAVRCCNEAIHKAEHEAREKRAKRAVGKVRKPSVRFERNALRRTYAVATARCPAARCHDSRTVRVAVGDTWNGKLTKVEAGKRASALAVAGIGKHVRARWHRHNGD